MASKGVTSADFGRTKSSQKFARTREQEDREGADDEQAARPSAASAAFLASLKKEMQAEKKVVKPATARALPPPAPAPAPVAPATAVSTSTEGPSSCAEFVESHSDAEMMESGKVRCTVTGHEMPAQLESLMEYWRGKKYTVAKARASYDFAQHEPWIVAHKKDPHLLYCNLTKQPLSKMPKTVQGHVSSKRFQRLLKEATDPAPPKGKNKKQTAPPMKASEGDGAAAGAAAGAAEAREEKEEEDEVDDEDDEDDGDAAEFFAEGAFWEREGADADDDDEDEDEDDDEEEVAAAATAAKDDEDAFWTRPSIKTGKKAKKQLKKQKGADGDAPAAVSGQKRKAREPPRVKGAPPVKKLGSKRVG